MVSSPFVSFTVTGIARHSQSYSLGTDHTGMSPCGSTLPFFRYYFTSLFAFQSDMIKMSFCCLLHKNVICDRHIIKGCDDMSQPLVYMNADVYTIVSISRFSGISFHVRSAVSTIYPLPYDGCHSYLFLPSSGNR